MSYMSHPPLRPMPKPSTRPMGAGEARYVDAGTGADGNAGTQSAPWRTVNYAVQHVPAGGTVYLRGGVYYENVYIARTATASGPITLRSFPGELAVIDGGIKEFLSDPAKAWEPVAGGVPDYYRSTGTYLNTRYMHASFAESMVGLQVYYHREDIEELRRTLLEQVPDQPFPAPVYLGPGVWHDAVSGRLYVRLTHSDYKYTHPGMADYRGVTDPRRLPMVVSPFGAVPLRLHGAENVIVQDVVVRGGGEETVVLQHCRSITLDNVVIYCGTYGLRSRSSGPVRLINSAMHGNIPPWFIHGAGCLRVYSERPGQPLWGRDVVRLNTHVMLVLRGRTEEMVDYCVPGNHDWEIAGCDFTDSFDGNHLSGDHIGYHHNRMDRIFDDALYLTPLTPEYIDDVRVYENLFTRCGMCFGFGGMSAPGGPIYVYRNVVDMRWEIPFAHNRTWPNMPIVMHFRNRQAIHLGPLYVYQNTIISRMSPRMSRTLVQDPDRTYGMTALTFTEPGVPRRVFNNLFVHLEGMVPPSVDSMPTLSEDVQVDGSVHFDPGDDGRGAAKVDAFRASDLFAGSRKLYPPGWEANARVGDPRFVRFDPDVWASNDYRLQAGSAAIGAGVPLPPELDDPLRPASGRPDAGALPFGAPPMKVGRTPQEDAPEFYTWLERPAAKGGRS